jgi:hypothetical protein
MKLDLNTIFAIISASKQNRDAVDNERYHEQLGFFIRSNGFTTTEVIGSHRDIKEKSYIVTGSRGPNGWCLSELMQAMAKAYNQDSFIICDGTGAAYTVSSDGLSQEMFTTVRPSQSTDTNYTIMPDGSRQTLSN